MWRHEKAKQRDPGLEQSIQAAMDDSSAKLEKLIVANQSSPSQQVEHNEMLLRLARAMEKLPEDQRSAFIQHHMLDLTYEEIAQAMDPPRTDKAVAGLVARARASLREWLQKED
jgi:RNA polymerase sigma-70 factor (ECF subfamily)